MVQTRAPSSGKWRAQEVRTSQGPIQSSSSTPSKRTMPKPSPSAASVPLIVPTAAGSPSGSLRPTRPALGESLDDHGHPLAAAHAHRLQAEPLTLVLEGVEEGGHDAGTGHAEGVAEGDGAALHVELLPGDAEMTGRGDDLGGEGLVDLDQVDVVDRHARPPQGLPAGLDGPETHDLGVQGRNAAGHDASQRGDPEL